MRFTFDQAVDYVKRANGEAFAFIPEKRLNKVIGGRIYLIVFHDDADEVSVHYSGGLFQSSTGEEEIYDLDEVPEEARRASYQAVQDGLGVFDLQTHVALDELSKRVVHDAR